MEFPETSSLAYFLKENKLPVAIFVISFVILGVGLIIFLLPTVAPKETVTFSLDQPITPAEKQETTTSVKTLMVDIAGAIAKPGVYELREGSRMQDVIVAAGGFSSEADNEQIAKTINLATKITDGMKIYIPHNGEELPAVLQALATDSTSQLINMNSASLNELDSLPGVGEVTAQKIIANRPYSDLSDLTTKKVISSKVFEQIQSLITL